MSEVSTSQHRRILRVADFLLPVALGVTFFIANGFYNWRRFIFEAERDEGYALIQALLLKRGYSLYSEIWSDQPPGFTYLVAGFSGVFGDSPETIRLLTVALVGIALAALYDRARSAWPGWGGHMAGLLGCCALVASEDFLRYACAAMIGMPAIALACIAWAVADRSAGRPGWDASAALLVALSLSVKPLAAPAAVPITLALLVQRLRSQTSWSKRGRAVLPFAGALTVGMFVAFAPLLFNSGLETLWEVHRIKTEEPWPGWPVAREFLIVDAWFLLPAALLSPFVVIRKNTAGIVAVAWALLALIALARFTPLWGHHRYVLLYPAAAIVGIGLAEWGAWGLGHDRDSSRTRARLRAAVAGLLVLAHLGIAVEFWPEQRARQLARYFEKEIRPSRAKKTLAQLQKLAPEAMTMTTMRHMHAYRLGLEVPPALAVTSRKRFNTGQLSTRQFAKMALAADSDIIGVDGRWSKLARRLVLPKIQRTHRRVLRRWKDDAFYVRKSLLPAKKRKRRSRSDEDRR